MPALPSCVIEPLWVQFAAPLPPRTDTHPWGCHRPRIPDWVVFDKLLQVLVWGIAYDRIVGLELDDVTVDGCLVKAPCGGQAAGRSPVDRGKQGTKRSLLTDGRGSRWAAWPLRPTATARRCCGRRWRSWPVRGVVRH